jgi:hypothetical protein
MREDFVPWNACPNPCMVVVVMGVESDNKTSPQNSPHVRHIPMLGLEEVVAADCQWVHRCPSGMYYRCDRNIYNGAEQT